MRYVAAGIVLCLCCVLSGTDITGYTTTATITCGDGPADACGHDKLKVFEDSRWTLIAYHEHCPTTYSQRAYKCKECKKTIVIQQAIVMPEPEKCEKLHWDATIGSQELILTY